MTYILDISEIGEGERVRVGEKAYRLSVLRRAGFYIPDFLCIGVEAFDEFISNQGPKPQTCMAGCPRTKAKDWSSMAP